MEDTTYPITVPGSEILGQLVRPEREYTVKLYDFKRPDKFSLEQINTVRVLHEALARQCAPILGRIAGTAVNVRCSSVDQMTYAEFLGSIPVISALVPVTMSPLKGPMLIQLDGSLASYLVRVACGGEAEREFEDPDRTLTELERVVFRDLAEQLVPIIDESWRNVIELGCAVTEIETDQQMVQLVPPTEMIILVSLEVRVGESAAFINFAIPYLTIEPIVGRLSMQWWFGKVRHGASTVAGRAGDFPVGVDLFAEADAIPLARLTAIASGDLLELPALADGTAQIAAGGVTVARVSLDPMVLTGSAPLGLAVIAHRNGPGPVTSSGRTGDDTSLAALLSSSVDCLKQQINEVRLAVEEIRDDRETLLANLTDGPVSPARQSGEPELDRRYHHNIAVLLGSEDPVVVGFVLAGLAPETAAAVLADLDSSSQPGVVRAIVALSDGDRSLHRKLLAFIGRRISRAIETTTSGGPDVVAEILNHTPRSVEKHVMETFIHEDKPLFEEIAKRMFVFEDFVLVDPVAIAKVAARVSTEELALAMKGMPSEVADHITGALNDEEAEALGLAIDNLGRVRRRDVEGAQRDMIEELRQLEQSGEVVVARQDEVIE